MSDDKDPVIEQIKRDTESWCEWMLDSAEDFDSFSHEMGRERQDPIAWNRCLDAVIGIVRNSDNVFEALELLEKLRR